MGVLWTIIIGFVAGVIAKFIMPGDNEPSGFILTTILGIVGAFVATYLGQALGWYRPGEGAGLIGAVVGAIIVLVVYGMGAGRRRTICPLHARKPGERGLRRADQCAIAWRMPVHDSPQAIPLEQSILDALMRAGTGTLSAPEIAHAIAPEGDWHRLLLPIRRAAVALAQTGALVIYRKGKPADPDDYPGIYRLRLPRQD